jgi:hypothetical protein
MCRSKRCEFGPDSLVARKETGQEISISPKLSVYERQCIEIAPGGRRILAANRRGPEFRATNGELVKVKSVDHGAITLEDGGTIPTNYHEFAHGYAVTARRSQGKGRPLATVLPRDVLSHTTLIAATLCTAPEDDRAAS